jgi:hypothetical protein
VPPSAKCSSLLFRWPGCALIWGTPWKYFEHYKDTLTKLDKRSRECPHPLGVLSYKEHALITSWTWLHGSFRTHPRDGFFSSKSLMSFWWRISSRSPVLLRPDGSEFLECKSSNWFCWNVLTS